MTIFIHARSQHTHTHTERARPAVLAPCLEALVDAKPETRGGVGEDSHAGGRQVFRYSFGIFLARACHMQGMSDGVVTSTLSLGLFVTVARDRHGNHGVRAAAGRRASGSCGLGPGSAGERIGVCTKCAWRPKAHVGSGPRK